MQPRLKSSKKWTPLPKELLDQIRSIFSQNFAEQSKNAKIEAGGRIYPDEILIRVGFKPDHSIRQQNWQISIAYKPKRDNVMKLLHLGLDAVGALFEQMFAAETDHDFPRTWEEVDFEKRKIHIQYGTENSDLEAEANRLLGLSESEDEDAVAQGDWDEDVDPDEIKAKLGLTDEEDDAEAKSRKDH